MMERMEFAEVVLPLPLNATFTYRVPETMAGRVTVGHRVVVPFGARKHYTGIVTALAVEPPKGVQVKEILSLLDDKPIVRHPQLKFWQWLSDYYMASLGDVYKAAIPAGLKVESETFLELNPDYDEALAQEGVEASLTDREQIVLHHLNQEGKMSVAAIVKATGFTAVPQIASRLLERGLVVVSEKIVERYTARKIAMVRPAFNARDPQALHAAFDATKGAPKQEQMLQTLLALSGALRPGVEAAQVTREALLEKTGMTSTILLALAKKGLVESYKKEVNRFAYDGTPVKEPPTLTPDQSRALDEIHRSFLDKQVTLLHGVTSSGKTELYMHLIKYVLDRGDQALMLVPEIALTTQLTKRLQRVFGSRVVIYHSKFTDNQRVDIWKRLLDGREPCVVIGARSALFLPFARLGLVIVDEEHESSYKQYDPSPRYNARDAAIVLATMHGAKTLLGSATPSVESYYKAKTGRWGLVEMTHRYGDAQLPDIEVVDLKRARLAGLAEGSLAKSTIDLASQALGRGEQAIFFLNRRGFAPMARCKACAYIPKCEHCDVSLTFHRRQNQLVCHYCGALYPVPTVCPQCHEPAIETVGYGTERVEAEVEQRFSQYRILRMDLDTTRSKDAYDNIIDDFSQHKADILVGTQMVTKGLDFAGVSVVAVLNADALINFPDFRSSERAFNMMSQVAGRAGRREGQQGRVVIQSYQPDNPILQFVKTHDYQGFYEHELGERQRYLYPPFARVIYIYLRHRDARTVDDAAAIHAQALAGKLGNRVFGPDEPAVSRVQSLYIRKIMVKLETEASPSRVKQILHEERMRLYRNPAFRSLLVHYDVDPQ
ncbi:MAG: primosomal protein N' [Bacteroidales bacterium]|nr:primosomal protein N' [Bacteroidales bacterium]